MGIAYDGDRLYATSFQLPNFSIWEIDPVPATAAGREGSGADILQAIPDPTPVVPRRGGFSAAAVARTGDLDGTQAVNGFDLAVLARSFGAERGTTRYAAGADLNRDGVIGPRDLAIFADAMSRPVRTRRR